MKKKFIRIKKSKRAQALLGHAICSYLRFVAWTARWQLEADQETQKLFDEGTPALFSFWHGRLLLMPAAWKKFVDYTPLSMLVSSHNDGNFASQVLQHYDVGFLRGSTRQDALAGAKAVMQCLKKGHSIGITVDGPKGPRMRVNSGICKMARMAKTPVVTASLSTSRGMHARSWDAMLVPLPFCKITVNVSAPLWVARGEEEEARQTLESRMISQQHACDHKMGRTEIQPAPK